MPSMLCPLNSDMRFVIYVKKGIYYENVRVENEKWNVMMFGDGLDNTIVSSNLSIASGTPTILTATFAAYGKGFIARDMGFQNTAGAAMYQAVALLSKSDQSVFYRCSIDAYQDTLYTQSNRQFYRECKIYGTIDIIFGDSSVVIQNSTILVKRPLLGQINTITAQGKSQPAFQHWHIHTKLYYSTCRESFGGSNILGSAMEKLLDHCYHGKPIGKLD
ncbi:hypothetical protein BUALT_Bualt05G0003300 [Buddleja alternifolia]|uniref:Pectinesterase n=1 Tax=Buddleja alternifolia TaxID=168488 RepID=A0AAV6XH79_9LAMI|nr:hypothetical protein BUALT_Bualt05G0003300 [Buddleja alternifolia]